MTPRGDGSAVVVPTIHYVRFHRAKENGQTVARFLTGDSSIPYSAMEEYLWQRYHEVGMRLDKQAGKK